MHVRTTADRRPRAARGRARAGLACAGKRGGRARAGVPFFRGKERGNERSEEKNKDKTQLDSELCYDGSVVKRTKRTRHRGRCRSPRACCSQLTAERLSFLLEMNYFFPPRSASSRRYSCGGKEKRGAEGPIFFWIKSKIILVFRYAGPGGENLNAK